MSHAYKAVGWNRQKKIYDRVLVLGIVFFLVLFMGSSKILQPAITVETLLIRGFGLAAVVLLHIILTIGPMARLDRRWLPLLYNRRHLGVAMFLLALVHGVFALVQFHALGDTHPLVSLFTANTRFDSVAQFPFQPLGFFALVILFLMAATSHDFWLANLGAPVWKTLHMLVYVAYVLVIAHVALGYLQAETSPVLAGLFFSGALWIGVIHLVAAYREKPVDAEHDFPVDEDGFLNVLGVDEIAEKRGRIVALSGDRIAVFKYDGNVSAISNACQHQNGPLGEGRIIDGYVTCPWHGYQYEPDTGASPPPFTEKVPTFNLKVVNGRIWIYPTPNPAGTRVAGRGRGGEFMSKPGRDDFYVGYMKQAAPGLARAVRRNVALVLVVVFALAVVLAVTQRQLGNGVFEYGNPRPFSGVVSSEPYPSLLVWADDGSFVRHHLVGFGKFGAAVESFDGRAVVLEASSIHRDHQRMLEIVPGTVKAIEKSPHQTTPVSLGTHTFTGEIVDSKCFLGVMNPGNLKTHKACAIRCISGGVPPVLLVRDSAGFATYLVLVSAQGEPVNEQVLGLVAEPVEITGEVERRDNLYYLKADPNTYKRLGR